MSEPTSLDFALKHFGKHPKDMTPSEYVTYEQALTWAPVSEGGYGYEWETSEQRQERLMPVVVAAGLHNDIHKAWQTFLIKVAVEQDEVVTRRVKAFPNLSQTTAIIQVVTEMTPRQREDLKDRIQRKLGATRAAGPQRNTPVLG